MQPHATVFLVTLLVVSCRAPARPVEDPSGPGDAPATEVASGAPSVERWRPRWTIADDFVADLGASLLVRHDRTSEDVTFKLHDALTGAYQRDLAWLPAALPPSQRTYTDRFTFAGAWVSVVEGEPRSETTVRDLATGTIAWRRALPSSIQLFEGLEGEFAFVVDHASALMGVASPATGTWRWSVPVNAAQQTVLGVTPGWVLTFESRGPDPSLPGTVVARTLADGSTVWTDRLANPPHAPILVRSNARWTAVAQGQSLTIRSGSHGQHVARTQVEQGIRSLALGADVVVVTTREGLVAYHAETARLSWRRDGAYDCARATGDTFMVVASDAEWQELDARTGALSFALGGGHCAWEFGAWSRGSGSLLLRAPGEIVSYERDPNPRSLTPLRVHGVLTLDGQPVSGVHITLGPQTRLTDARGRFEFLLRTRGRYALRVDEDQVGERVPGRCVNEHSGEHHFEHDGSGGERRVDFSMESGEPNPLTRCSQM